MPDGAYYNEIDPFAAQWLRNLIAAGYLPAGRVDERSIVDIDPAELVGHRECHFFAGIGGWPYALQLAGWPEDREVWTGSCPCQPLSSAGQRKGHADKRHLWPAFYRLIAERSPPIVFGEQVASKDGREWLAGVRADLEGLGYAVGAADLCAAGVGAPHIRQRLFWLAEFGDCFGLGNTSAPGLSPSERQELCGERRLDEGRAIGESSGSPWPREFIDCLDGKARRAEPGVFPLADGVFARVGRLRGYGNAIVPQVAAEFVQAFLETQSA